MLTKYGTKYPGVNKKDLTIGNLGLWCEYSWVEKSNWG